MHVFGQPDAESSSFRQPSMNTAPFTFIFTRIRTSGPTCASPLLNLPPELRNKVFEYVGSNQDALRLSGDRIVLPPLGSVCKKIRKEMSAIFEHEIVKDTALAIEARVVNFDFRPLFSWLDKNDQACNRTENENARELKIHVTCRPDLPGCEFPRLDESLWGRPTLRAKEMLQKLLRDNLRHSLSGWSDLPAETIFLGPDGLRVLNLNHHHVTPAPGEYPFHAHPLLKRSSTGSCYWIGFVADSTWRCQDIGPLKGPNKHWFDTNFYNSMYGSVSQAQIADWMLALRLLEVCQSDCSKSARDAVAAAADDDIEVLLRQAGHKRSHTAPFWKWTKYVIHQTIDQTAKRIQAVAEDRRKGRKLVIENFPLVNGIRLRPNKKRCGSDDTLLTGRDKARRVGSRYDHFTRRKLYCDGTESELDEITRLMEEL